jgi:hypothetical protein
MFKKGPNFIFDKIIISLFRNEIFINPKSTKGGHFYIDLPLELMEKSTWGQGDYAPALEYLREETIKRYKEFIVELKKLETTNLIKIKKVEGAESLSILTKDEFQELIYINDVFYSHWKHYELSYIKWEYFLNHISDKIASYRIKEEDVFSEKKQQRIVMGKIKERVIFLEKENDIILNSDNFKDVNLLSSLTSLESLGYISINGVKIIKKYEDNIFNYYEYQANISITPSFNLREESLLTKEMLFFSDKDISQGKINKKTKKQKEDNQEKKLSNFKIYYNRDESAIIIGKYKCKIPRNTKEEDFCICMFEKEKNKWTSWDIIAEDINEENEEIDKKARRAIQDKMYSINKKIQKTINTNDKFFEWDGKSIKRNY